MIVQRISENLTRQIRALELLSALLEEEFSDLKERRPHDVSALEFSIQELIRQVAAERKSLRGIIHAAYPGRKRVREVVQELPAEAAEELSQLLHGLDRLEQVCAIQTDKNRQLALGLYDQSMRLLKQLHQAIEPGKSDVYSRKGRYAQAKQSQASVFNGRF